MKQQKCPACNKCTQLVLSRWTNIIIKFKATKYIALNNLNWLCWHSLAGQYGNFLVARKHFAMNSWCGYAHGLLGLWTTYKRVNNLQREALDDYKLSQPHLEGSSCNTQEHELFRDILFCGLGLIQLCAFALKVTPRPGSGLDAKKNGSKITASTAQTSRVMAEILRHHMARCYPQVDIVYVSACNLFCAGRLRGHALSGTAILENAKRAPHSYT